MPTALIFGATGQLGVAVAEETLAAGWRVLAVARGGRGLPAALAGAVRIDGEGMSAGQVLNALPHTVDAVFDGTAYGAADASALLRARGRYGALVVVSSASVYEDPQGRSMGSQGVTGFPVFAGAIAETAGTVLPPSPRLRRDKPGYAAGKVAMEQALLGSGAAVSVLRPCAVYGRYALHPREWWFLKRGLDGRGRIPVAYGGESRFHTSSARGIARLARLCMEQPGARVLNVADREALSVVEIAGAICAATGVELGLAPFNGAPVGASYVGSTPWSCPGAFVLDCSAARALGWDPGAGYGVEVAEVCEWVMGVARAGDWRAAFTRFAGYGYDPFDYAAEDRVLDTM